MELIIIIKHQHQALNFSIKSFVNLANVIIPFYKSSVSFIILRVKHIKIGVNTKIEHG